MFWITSVPFCRTKELTGSEELPSLVQVILGLRSLSASHGRRRVKPNKGVTTWWGRILKRKGENITSWAATDTDPRIFCALHRYVPPSLFVTLQIVKAPFTTEVLSFVKLPTAFDHVTLGCGWPEALQKIVTFCPSSAISRLDDKRNWGWTG